MYYQHGDLLLKRVDFVKEGCKVTKVKKAILAEGEHTGHKHMLISESMPITIHEKDGEVFVKTESETELIHQEHNMITIEPGIYKVEQVKEYDHFEEEIRKIQD